MRECPKCGYVDPPYWRNRLFDYEVDICLLSDLGLVDKGLALDLFFAKRGETIIREPYAYKLTKTNWVYRIWYPLLKVRSWNPQKYYDGTGSRASALRKVNLQAYNQRQMFVKAVRDSGKNSEILKKIDDLERRIKIVDLST